MKKTFSFLKKYWPILFLFTIEFPLFVINYKSGTYLIGWDNLLPELNFSANIKRSVFAVWQEYRGLGLLDGMSHAANLVHHLFLFFLSFFLPKNLLRYFFTFLMHFLGGVGVFLLLEKELLKDKAFKRPAAFLGSPFYLFNLATIQMFYTPLEVFSIHFAALPWLTYFLIKYLKSGKKGDLVFFLFSSLLSTPQAFVPSIFLVYLLFVLAILFFSILRRGPHCFKKAAIVLFLIFAINSFWGLPFIYSAFNNAKVISQSKINQMSTDDLFLRNKAYGDFVNTILLHGFSFGITDHTQGKVEYLMKPWVSHIKNPVVNISSILFFLLAILGLAKAISARERRLYPFLSLFIFFFLMLGNNIPVFSLLYHSFQKFIPFFHQVFRITFTKFAIGFAFCYAIFLALGTESLLSASFKVRKKLPVFLFAVLCLLITVYTFPSFQGNFLYKNLKVKIPKEYFELFEFFKKQDRNTRIATLPQPSFWGWIFYKWGIRGSGFLWYGIEQPTLDRAFDPWSQENEGYYWELSYALSSHNPLLFKKVLQKYQINWILLDENVFAPGPARALQIERLKETLKNSKIISPAASFGKLKVYKVNLPFKEKKFVFLVDHPLRIEPTYKWANKDQAFVEDGIYYSFPPTSNLESRIYFYYPFRELFTNNYVQEKNWRVEIKDQHISFKTKLATGKNWSKKSLNLDSLEKEEKILLYRNDLEEYELSAEVIVDNNELEVQMPKYNLVRPEEIDFTQKKGKKETCDQLKRGEYDLEVIKEEKRFLRLSSQGTSSCTSFNFPYLDHDYSYLLEIESRNISGKELFFYVANETTKRAVLEILLPKSKKWTKSYYILPPGDPYGKGYSLHFDNLSIGKEKTINDLGDIKIYPIPFNFLKELKFSVESPFPSSFSNTDFVVQKKNPSFYKIHLPGDRMDPSEVEERLLLVLSQSFDPGWMAYQVKKEKLKIKNWEISIPKLEKLGNHVLVNNWANGWRIDKLKIENEKVKIRIIYLPQFLQYLGFLMVGLSFGWVVKLKTSKEKSLAS